MGKSPSGPRLFAQEAAEFSNRLKIPELIDGTPAGNARQFQLTLQQGASTFLPDTVTPTLGINGDFLGPTLHFRQGEEVAMSVQNLIGEASSLHWHGLRVPAIHDGGPFQQIENGATWTPGFRILQRAGTYWYHPHVFDKTGEQVYRGLAGLILVDDEESQQLDLPSNYGIDDIPLIVQDRQFNEDGSFRYMADYRDLVMGSHGNVILVNGTINPIFTPSTKLVRFRLLNAANARTFTFAFSDGREFQQIASDGGLLENSVNLEELELAPGERAEILVDFSNNQNVTLVSLSRGPNFPVFIGAMSEMMRALNTEGFDLLAIHPQTTLADNGQSPDSLVGIEKFREEDAQNTRPIRLSMGYGQRSGEDRGPGIGARNGLGGGYGGGNHVINGRKMAVSFVNARIPLGSTEIWELSNNSPMMHPFHVHNGQFQILDRNGQPPPLNEQGWKDTVRVGSGEELRIIMRFDDYADNENPYMYHCHILEHEDLGMMGQFLVVDE
ncbi:MAG: multicopper oxidase domain-containing protein [Gammaproteobacteria bacterium]|jgi:FtsP/CotA-like multicopper oxidase with cupredoxin domain|nr:multicopper oxidase domain-containing protein [Gammaproteobacteria bacterium]|tara:strand:+ start:4688 stop:6181 length:1494 start_codon:yes stop_codon:yes gene_type:complete